VKAVTPAQREIVKAYLRILLAQFEADKAKAPQKGRVQ
jgi:hypothetical protein